MMNGSHGETGGEHFRKHNHIRRISDLPDLLLEHGQVGFDILPMEIGLDKRDFQILHSIVVVFKIPGCKETPFAAKSLRKNDGMLALAR
jgi:hypothetical protein